MPKVKRTVLFDDGKPKPGRPPKLTLELQDKICKIVGLGAPLETAASAVGIADRTLRIWRAKGERERAGTGGRHAAFLDAIESAKSQGITGYIESIAKASGEDWRAAAHMLKCLVPHMFGDKSSVHVQLREDRDKLLQIAHDTLPRAQFVQLLTAITNANDPSISPNQVAPSEADEDG
jgi:hypothetical protein